MIAHILPKPSRTFAGVSYNTDKIERNTGELMHMANFGALMGLSSPRPQDLVNYLKMIASVNRSVKNTQFHAFLSSRGKIYDKDELTRAAILWMKEMKYGDQPYFIVFHKDTGNNHVHIVSSRIGRDGKLIDRDYERVRALRSIDKVLGYTAALQYRFSTKAQFYLILERGGYIGKDYIDEVKLQKKIASHTPDKDRIAELRSLFMKHRNSPDLLVMLKERYRIDVVLHAKEGKKPYGYSVIDHETCQVFKGSEILSLKYLLDENIVYQSTEPVTDAAAQAYLLPVTDTVSPEPQTEPAFIRTVWIAPDVDDEAVLGPTRRRKRKARTNTR